MSELSLDAQSEFQYWYPKVKDFVPTPETIILKLPNDVKAEMWAALDGEKAPDTLDLSLIYDAIDVIGYPAFIRTENGSGKHYWDDCCYLERKEDLFHHLCHLLEWSCCVDIIGLKFEYLIIRKYLKSVSGFKAFKGMPVAKEYRVFVKDGTAVCYHFYWPEDAIEVFGDYTLPDNWKLLLEATSVINLNDRNTLLMMAETFGSHLLGNWSVDFMLTEEGWVMIDAARAEHSWHPESCPHQLYWRDG